jgi:hypothetical protein
MGIGGAVLYSLAFMAVHALVRGVALAARSLRGPGRAFLDAAALHGASVAGVQLFPDPLSRRRQEWSTQRPGHDGATGD